MHPRGGRKQSLRMIEKNIEVKNLKFVVDTDVVHDSAICDKLRLAQVLPNVAGNAVRFTPQGGAVGVSITERPGAPEGYAFYGFCIGDIGIGVDRAFLPRIFEPFEREQSSTAGGIRSAGLDLSITKSIVNMMNGAIEAESEKGRGSCFTVCFTFRLAGGQREYARRKSCCRIYPHGRLSYRCAE